MKYLNTNTNNIIETQCQCSGGDWVVFEDEEVAEEAEEAVEEVEETKKARGKSKKNG